MSVREDDAAILRGLLWHAWYEFNAIRARSGAPLDQHGERLCHPEYWGQLTDAFAAAIGEDALTPWPSPEATLLAARSPQGDEK